MDDTEGMDDTERLDADDPDHAGADAESSKQPLVGSVALIVAGLIAIVLVVADAVSSETPDGHVTVTAEVVAVESRFERNAARRKHELVFYPTVRFEDPATGERYDVELNQPSGRTEGSSVDVSLRPGSPGSVRLATGTSPLITAVGILVGLAMIGYGIPNRTQGAQAGD